MVGRYCRLNGPQGFGSRDRHLANLVLEEEAKTAQQQRATQAANGGVAEHVRDFISGRDAAHEDDEEAGKATEEKEVFHKSDSVVRLTMPPLAWPVPNLRVSAYIARQP